MKGRIARISRSAVHDGPGVRTVVFFKGCPLRCQWCHSPETQALDPEILLLNDRCIACASCVEGCKRSAARLGPSGPSIDRSRCARCGECVELCPSGARELQGELMDVEEVMAAIRRDVPFYDASGGGVTFSGGEPLMQPTFLAALLERCRRERIGAAIETCGHANRHAVLRAMKHAPLFLYDVKLADDTRHRAVTGASNALILANLRELAARGAGIVIRLPLVPGVTDDEDNVRGIATLAASAGVSRIDVLPYHRAGVAKYARLGRPYALDGMPAADTESVEWAAALLRGLGLDARVGGTS